MPETTTPEALAEESTERPVKRGYVITVHVFDGTDAEEDATFDRVATATHETDLADGDYFVFGRRMTQKELDDDAAE